VTISCIEAEGVNVRKCYIGHRTDTEWETDAATVLVSSNQALPLSFSSQESVLQSSCYSRIHNMKLCGILTQRNAVM
jgi:hypothetical protein